MLLTETRLRTYSSHPILRNKAAASLKNYAYLADATVFLSHSSKDKRLAEYVKTVLGGQGISVYIDWQDSELPAKATRQTAKALKERIKEHKLFLLLLTNNSAESRWVPWELGIADQAKGLQQTLIFPVGQVSSHVMGRTYLQLYHHIRDLAGELRVAAPGRTTSQVALREFLQEAAR